MSSGKCMCEWNIHNSYFPTCNRSPFIARCVCVIHINTSSTTRKSLKIHKLKPDAAINASLNSIFLAGSVVFRVRKKKKCAGEKLKCFSHFTLTADEHMHTRI